MCPTMILVTDRPALFHFTTSHLIVCHRKSA